MKIKIESHERYGQCRVGEGWVVAVDVARILGYVKGTTFANKHVARDDKRYEMVRALNATNVAKTMLVNKAGVEAMIEASANAEAEEIRAWLLSIMEKEPPVEEANLPQVLVPQVFNHPQFGNLRAVNIGGEPFFIGVDVAKALGYKNSSEALQDHVPDKFKKDGVAIRDPIGREQSPVLINEAGLYKLVMRSRLPKAEEFSDWACGEVAKTCEKALLPLANDTSQVFTHPQFGSLHIVLIDGTPYFVGIEVARTLEYQNGSRDIERHVDESDRLTRKIYWAGQMREMILINKSGVYSLILDSQMPKAKEYRHWVTSEILPQIDEKGFYSVKPLEPPAIVAVDFTALVERMDRLELLVQTLIDGFAQAKDSSDKQLSKADRADKLLQVADRLPDSPDRQKILLHAANLINGKKIF